MSDSIVMDASASIALLRQEPIAAEIRLVINRVRERDEAILVPELFWLEVTNALARRHGLGPDDVLAAMRDIDELGPRTVASHRGLVILGVDLMSTHGLSAYDASYLALAQAEGARLLTADRRLGRAAGDRSVITLPRAVHEQLAPYGMDLPVGTMAAHGAYLAELRREAEAGILR
jgi:predicted nucleic acid-binding protein